MRYPNLEAELARSKVMRKELADALNLSNGTITMRLRTRGFPFSYEEVKTICSVIGMEFTEETYRYLSKEEDDEKLD